jgi:hypothetical protein
MVERALTGQFLPEMVRHTSLVYYSVDSHSLGVIASGGEDHLLKIWKGDLFCIQYNTLVKLP